MFLVFGAGGALHTPACQQHRGGQALLLPQLGNSHPNALISALLCSILQEEVSGSRL